MCRVCTFLVLLALSVLIPFTRGVDAIPFSIQTGDLEAAARVLILSAARGG